MTDPDVAATPTNPWVAEFAAGWREPTDADAFADHFRATFQMDCRFRQPLILGKVIGVKAFRERFVGPTFDLISDMRGCVVNWAARDDTIYIEMEVDGYIGKRPVTLRSCERITLRDGLWAERVTYLDSLPLLYAVIRTPKSWPMAIRLQIQNIRKGWRNR
ncbi:MAG TPA: nuclear transport factor 2 family protein [Sporichthyaceae bacterium]|nr:nuclear transport factor 2 family protein [Sporichthyaceae bacterium]